MPLGRCFLLFKCFTVTPGSGSSSGVPAVRSSSFHEKERALSTRSPTIKCRATPESIIIATANTRGYLKVKGGQSTPPFSRLVRTRDLRRASGKLNPYHTRIKIKELIRFEFPARLCFASAARARVHACMHETIAGKNLVRVQQSAIQCLRMV